MEDGGIEFENDTLIRPREIRVEAEDGEERERENQKRQRLETTETEKEEQGNCNGGGGGGGGGILDNLISKLSSPRAPKPIDVEAFDPTSPQPDNGGDGSSNGGDGSSNGGDGSSGGGGGVINSIISSLFHQKEGEVNKEEGEVGNKIEDEEETEAGGTHTGSGGSIITNLVPDEVDPTSDEASILIHSVVHD